MRYLPYSIPVALLALMGSISPLGASLPAVPAPAEGRRLPHAEFVAALAFSPDGQTLATAAGDKVLRLWEVASGKELRRFTGHKDAVLAVAFSRDGKTLATGSADNTVRLWNAATGAEFRRFLHLRSGSAMDAGDVAAVVFVADGQAVVSASSGGRDFQAVRQAPVFG